MAEKTEQATPRRLREARKRGQVATSHDFPSAFTFVTSIAATLALSGYLFRQLGGCTVQIFSTIPASEHSASLFLYALQVIFNCSFPILLLTAAIGTLLRFLVVGPLFAPARCRFDLQQMNPVTNIHNIFKLKTLFELLKSLLKIAGALFLIYNIAYNSLTEVQATASLPVSSSAAIFAFFLRKVLIQVGIFFVIVAIIDLFFQKYTFAKEMMMAKFEVKRDYRETEGDPYIKSRQRQTAREIAYHGGPALARQAKAIVTNPIHLAVALDYQPATEPAPRILTMGEGLLAKKIIAIAEQHQVPIMRNVELARTLYQRGTIDDYIPEETYAAVAEILKWIESLQAAQPEAHPALFS